MPAMLVWCVRVKNKSIFLLWELDPIFMQILCEKILLYWPPTLHHGCLVTWLQAKNTQTKTALVFNYFCLLLRGQSTTFLWPFRGCLHSRHFLVVFSLLWDCCPVVSGTWETGEAKKLWLYITNSCSSTSIGKGMTIKKNCSDEEILP